MISTHVCSFFPEYFDTEVIADEKVPEESILIWNIMNAALTTLRIT